MSDFADLANDAAQLFLDNALLNRPSLVGGVSALQCSDCGYSIPEARRAAVPGTTTCVDCAQMHAERTQHIWGGY